MKIVLFCMLLAAPGLHRAQAADVTLVWTVPSANTDGTSPAMVGGYNIYAAATDALLTGLPDTRHGGKALSVGNVLTYTYHNVAPGTYVYAITAWYCLTGGTCTESEQSGHVSTTVGAPVVTATTPTAPGAVKVTVTVTVSSP